MTKNKLTVNLVSKLAVAANIFLFFMKLFAGLISGSFAVLADAINSGSDIFASSINYIGIRISQKPSDKKHPYGHHKYEVLVGLLITIIIFGSGLYIIYESVKGFLDPTPIQMSLLAIIIMALSAIVNEAMARLKIYTGTHNNSVGLVADGVHSRIDVLSSAAVFLGLIFSNYWVYVDPIIASLVGLWIIKESISLGREATDNLVDVAADEEKEQKVKSIVESMTGIELTDLKTQKRGSKFSANLTVALPSELSVDQASGVTEKLRQKLMEQIPELDYTTISIQGSDKQTSYYKGFSWRGRGYRWRQQLPASERLNAGPGGVCICPKCGYTTPHERGKPCATLKCPKCNIELERKNDKRSK